MRRKNSLLFLAMAISACSTTRMNPGSGQSIEVQLNARFRSLVDAAQSLDHDAYLRHFDPHLFTSLNENGTVTHSFDTFQKDYLAGVETIRAYQQLEFKNVKVSIIDPQHAVLVNEYSSTVELKNGSVLEFAGAGTQVWHKSDGAWLLVNVSSSGATE